MDGMVRALAVTLAGGALMSVSPASGPEYSPEMLALLDPTSRVTGLCGSRDDGSSSLRARLIMAAAVAQGAPESIRLYDGLGKVHFPVSTSNPLAQRYFDQGLAFSYGFNHAAAIASFREAQRLDPSCAMCFWGEAFAHGPNINAPMDPEANDRAVAMASYAHWLARNSTPMEQALTAAMLKRYSTAPDADRSELDAAYADAMLAAAATHPQNDDIAVLAAEAAMDTRPWDYWQADRKTPQPRIDRAVQLVETVLARNPEHPQGAHLYIHLMENGPDPKVAEAPADRLAAPLSPTAGHLVHMPAHIYYRLGRWKDSIGVNVDAARADEAYIQESGDSGLYRYGYYPHNVHFIVTSAQMAGDMATAIQQARKLQSILNPEISAKMAWVQAVDAAPYFAAAQFADPETILKMAEPDPRLAYVRAMRHYARAIARAQLRDSAGFQAELRGLRALRETDVIKAMAEQAMPAPDLLQIADLVAQARWAHANRRYAQAADLYREAIRIEDGIPYTEPPFWYYPVHQSLGAALYRAGRHEEAVEAFSAALARSPNNGWALYGLAESERALGRLDRAAAAEAALQRAWAGDPRWLRMDRL